MFTTDKSKSVCVGFGMSHSLVVELLKVDVFTKWLWSGGQDGRHEWCTHRIATALCKDGRVGERLLHTLPASLSGTFLQTLPDLVTPLKGHSLSPRSCPPTRSAPSERFGY